MKPQGKVESLIFEAYGVLVQKLARVVGYRVQLLPADEPIPTRFRYSHDGHLQYSILSNKNTHLATLELDSEAKEDEFATKTTKQFVDRARKLFNGCHHQRDLKQIMIREEPMFWDELIIGFTFPKNQHPESLRILWTIRNALHFRYEGQIPKIGVFVTWNLDTVSGAQGTSTIKLHESPNLDELLNNSKASYLLSNGEESIYLVEGRRVRQLLYRLSGNDAASDQEEGWEFIPRQYRWLRGAVKGRDFAVINSNPGEQTLVTSKAVMKWSGNLWSRITHSRIASMFPQEFPSELRRLVLDIVGTLSHKHTGALLILPNDVDGLLQICSAGLSSRLSGRKFIQVTPGTREIVENLCAIDGGTIIDASGTVVDAGVLVSLGTPSGEGARSAAAAAASAHGLAIKVSHDGPITFFVHGERIATVG